MGAPTIVHELLDRIWDESEEGSHSRDFRIYTPIILGEHRFAAKMGGDAIGVRIATPKLSHVTAEPLSDDKWRRVEWQGSFSEEEID